MNNFSTANTFNAIINVIRISESPSLATSICNNSNQIFTNSIEYVESDLINDNPTIKILEDIKTSMSIIRSRSPSPTYTSVEPNEDVFESLITFETSQENSFNEDSCQIQQQDTSSENQTSKSELPRKRKSPQFSAKEKLEQKRKEKILKHLPKPPCDNICRCKCTQKISEDYRKEINMQYWNMSPECQRWFILKCISQYEIKRRKAISDSRRNVSFKYEFQSQDGNSVQVCRAFFLTTLGYEKGNDSIIKMVMSRLSKITYKDKRGCRTVFKTDRTNIREHILSYNPRGSHYKKRRAPKLNVKVMHKDFMDKYPNEKVSYELYRAEVNALSNSYANPNQCIKIPNKKVLENKKRPNTLTSIEKKLETSNLIENISTVSNQVYNNITEIIIEVQPSNNMKNDIGCVENITLDDNLTSEILDDIKTSTSIIENRSPSPTYTSVEPDDDVFESLITFESSPENSFNEDSCQSQQQDTSSENQIIKKKQPKQHKSSKEGLQDKLEQKRKEQMLKHLPKPPCDNVCRYKCTQKINEEHRTKINMQYWNMTPECQRWFILKCTTQCEIKRRKTMTDSRRSVSFKYEMQSQTGDLVQVCRTFFLTTLGYEKNNDSIIRMVKARLSGISNKDNKKCRPPVNKIDRTNVREHILSYNPVSHQNKNKKNVPKRMYLPRDMNVKTMHKDFMNKYPNEKVSYKLYRGEVRELNIFFADMKQYMLLKNK